MSTDSEKPAANLKKNLLQNAAKPAPKPAS